AGLGDPGGGAVLPGREAHASTLTPWAQAEVGRRVDRLGEAAARPAHLEVQVAAVRSALVAGPCDELSRAHDVAGADVHPVHVADQDVPPGGAAGADPERVGPVRRPRRTR